MLTPGARLGPYEIVSVVGAGGMGTVYKARDTRLDRTVAIKMSSERFSDRFEREARAVAALNHPHICQLYDVGPDYLVMEYVDGAPLVAPLPLDDALRYAGQVLDALDAAHRKGIVHRDLKPANILIDRSGAKLLDFGIAKMTAPQSADAIATRAATAAHTIVGTLRYMSPEQVQARETDARSDIFSFGLVLFELLTGRPPFTGDSDASLVAAVLKDDPPKPSSIRTGTIPEALDHIVATCLAKDPDDRWQTVRDLKRELVRATTVRAAMAMAAAPDKRREKLWVGLAAAGVIAAAVMTVAYIRKTPPPAPPMRVSILPPGEGATFVADPNWGGSALSPDGTTIAFIAAVNGKRSLYVRALDSLDVRSIPNTETAGQPFWSPDGHSIGFFGNGVFRADPRGGEPVRLSDGTARGGAWNRDGVILFANALSSGKPGGVFRVSASGGESQRVTTLDAGENAHYWPQFLPDGNHFLFMARSAQPERNAIYIGSLDDAPAQAKRIRILSSSYRAVYAPSTDGRGGYLIVYDGGILFAQPFDPTTFALSGQRVPIASNVSAVSTNGFVDVTVSSDGKLAHGNGIAGSSRVMWRDRQGTSRDAGADTAIYNDVTLSPDGRKAVATAFTSVTGSSDIIVLDLERGTRSPVIRGQTGPHYGVWSADGREIAYDTPDALFSVAANGAGSAERILDAGGEPSGWSRDGLLMYETRGASGHMELWVLPITGDRKPRPYLQRNADLRHGVVSPDGRFVAYSSDESGTRQVYVETNPPGKGKWQISIQSGSSPQWREDGKELFFASVESGRNNRTLMAASVRASANSIEAGTVSPLFEWPAQTNTAFGVTDMGRRFLVVEPARELNKSLTLLLQWQHALK
jgi:Tol biopolymer transport system component/tRNA A-37 threonylcarbamoyl transferase component Bud32